MSHKEPSAAETSTVVHSEEGKASCIGTGAVISEEREKEVSKNLQNSLTGKTAEENLNDEANHTSSDKSKSEYYQPSNVNVWALRKEKMIPKKHSHVKQEKRFSKSLQLQDPNVWPSPEIAEKQVEDRKLSDDSQKPLAPKANGKEKWVTITPNFTHTPISNRKSSRSRNDGSRRNGNGRRRGNYSSHGSNKRQTNYSREKDASRSIDSSNPSAEYRDDINNTFGSQTVSSANGKEVSQTSEDSSSQAPHHSSSSGHAPSQQGGNKHSYKKSDSQQSFHHKGRSTRKGQRHNNGFYRNIANNIQGPFPNYPVVVNGNGVNPYLCDVQAFLTSQLEYYFSIENLCKDMFLRKHMDDEGYVPLAFLASFNRIKSFSTDLNLLHAACKASDIIDVAIDLQSPMSIKVRRKETWSPWILPSESRLKFEMTNYPQINSSSSMSPLASSISNLTISPPFIPSSVDSIIKRDVQTEVEGKLTV
ncbi:RNA-binding protein [Schizosaccharomyces pombe]